MDNLSPAQSIKENQTPGIRLTWIGIGLLWLLGLALGFYGLAQYARSTGQDLSVLDLIYRLLQLVTLESGALSPPIPWPLEAARFGLPALAAWTVVRATMHLFREQARRISILLWRNHLIIAGLSRKGFRLAIELAAAGQKVVVIEQEASHALIAVCQQRGIVVLKGDATAPSELVRAQVRRAGALIAVTGDDIVNAEVAIKANEIMRALHRSPLHCFVHIINPGMWNLMRRWEVAQGKFEAIRVELFNVYQRGADFLIDEYGLANPPNKEAVSSPNLLIVGLGSLSEHLVVQVARKWFHTRFDLEKIEVVVVDPQATEKLELLAARYPGLQESAELIPVRIGTSSAAFEKGEFVTASNFELALIDIPDDDQALATALTVRELLAGRSISVAIHMSQSGGIHRFLEQMPSTSANEPELRPFTLIERVCDRHFLHKGVHERLARGLHQAYLENRRKSDTWDASDPALQRWETLPHSIQNSNRAQADFIGTVLRENGHDLALLKDWSQPHYQFSESEVDHLARSEHDRWRRERVQQGWRYAPELKNDENKTHPDLVDWGELPEGEKEKNRAFVRSWPLILHQAGFKITAE